MSAPLSTTPYDAVYLEILDAYLVEKEIFLEKFQGAPVSETELIMFLYQRGLFEITDGEEIMRAITEAET